ncbi:MAG TPA: hypothetical protein VGT08_19485 [Terracidiphilus sp.]|nr:hypothetical protein [Terracidiphilus sp.]
MNTHPYLRAYLAGIFVPTLVLPLILAGFITLRLVLALPIPIERFVIFPMAVVPTIFGLWNMLYLWSHLRTNLPIGVHGAILPFLGAPTGALVASCLGMLQIGSDGVTWFHAVHAPYAFIAVVFLAAVAGYYLVWKYIVGFLNRVMGIA